MSIRKRTWKTSKGESKEAWIVDYADAAGKRRQKTFDNKKERSGRLSGAGESRCRRGSPRTGQHEHHGRGGGGSWLTTCRGRELERATLEGYERHAQMHIAPAIGTMKLSRLTAPLVRQFEDNLRAGGRRRRWSGGPGLPRVDLGRRAEAALCLAMPFAIFANRTKGAERRADRRQKGKLKIGVICEPAAKSGHSSRVLKGRWRPILLTAVFTGLRASELRGLRWADVDLTKSEIHVRQRADRFNVIGRPKSESGERTIPLPPIITNTLREWKAACPIGDLVFPNGSAKIETHSNIVKSRAGAFYASKPASSTPMARRNARACMLCAISMPRGASIRIKDGGLGLSAKAAQNRLGHATIAMTLDTYGHLFPSGDDGSELAAAQNRLLG